MKKITLSIIIIIASFSSFAQSSASELSPFIPGPGHPPLTTATDRALWDIQMDVPFTGITFGLAACYWTGNEFWIARFGVDSIFILNHSGALYSSFVIPGISFTRSITSDGNFIYIGANTPDIYKVNPATRTVVATITTSIPNCRYVTYDPTLDSGAGGFWVGDFATDWTAVSMAGTTLSSILATTHGLTGVYGLAYDTHTAGGPYLWAYDQGNGSVGTAILRQVSVATGMPTGLMHDTQLDLQGGNAGIAGGVFVQSNYVTGTTTLGGICQTTSIFCYNIQAIAGLHEHVLADFSMMVAPNPATDESVITFSLREENSVKLDVFSITGAKVYSINNGIMNIGKHTIELNTANLDNGLYFVNLTVGGRSVVEKVSVNR